MDQVEALQIREQNARASAPSWESGRVIELNPGTGNDATPTGWVKVNCSGGNEVIRTVSWLTLQVGDSVAIMRSRVGSVVVGVLSSVLRPPARGVVIATGTSVVTVAFDDLQEVQLDLPYLLSYTPAVSDNVYIHWTDSGGVVMGKLSQTTISGFPNLNFTTPDNNSIPGDVTSGTTYFSPEFNFYYLHQYTDAAGNIYERFFDDMSIVRQGLPPGGTWNYYGAYYFNNQMAATLPPGATVSSLKIKLSRIAGGDPGAETIQIYASDWPWPPQAGDEFGPIPAVRNDNLTTPYITTTMSIGETKIVDLPLEWAVGLQINLGYGAWAPNIVRSIGVEGTDYAVFSGISTDPEAGQLIVEWSL